MFTHIDCVYWKFAFAKVQFDIQVDGEKKEHDTQCVSKLHMHMHDIQSNDIAVNVYCTNTVRLQTHTDIIV